MVPLYAARVRDLGPDDVAVFKCGACGHTAELPPSALIRGLGLQPTDKVLDLERRLRCRLCYAREQAGVSIRGKISSSPPLEKAVSPPPPFRVDPKTQTIVDVNFNK